MTENDVPDRFATIAYRVNDVALPVPRTTKLTNVVPVNVDDHEDIKTRNDITEKIAKDNRIRTRAESFSTQSNLFCLFWRDRKQKEKKKKFVQYFRSHAE